MDDGHPLGIAADADRGDQSRNAGADVLAHDDGDSDAVGDGAGHGQCLQNANGGGGGLDDAGEGLSLIHISHPLAVAQIVAEELHLDSESIEAALLHDVIEDTDATYDDVAKLTSPTVADRCV